VSSVSVVSSVPVAAVPVLVTSSPVPVAVVPSLPSTGSSPQAARPAAHTKITKPRHADAIMMNTSLVVHTLRKVSIQCNKSGR